MSEDVNSDHSYKKQEYLEVWDAKKKYGSTFIHNLGPRVFLSQVYVSAVRKRHLN